MILYLGTGQRARIFIAGSEYSVHMRECADLTPGLPDECIITADNYIIQSKDGYYLTFLDDSIDEFYIVSTDDYLFQTLDGQYLTIK